MCIAAILSLLSLSGGNVLGEDVRCLIASGTCNVTW